MAKINQQNSVGFWDRAIRNLKNAWEKIASTEESFSASSLGPDLDDDDRAKLIEQMNACLIAKGGEVSARSRAAALGHAYLALNQTGRKRFLYVLAQEFDPNPAEVDAAIEAVKATSSQGDRQKAEQILRLALSAPRIKLLTQFNALPEGVKFLVDMRAELVPLARQDPKIKGVESDLKTLLTSWFDVGFLELRQITWQASASLLEKFFIYEAVHKIQGWDDLKHRLSSNRRCFAFFHPRMPDEPLIFVWVALVEGIAGNIQDLLDQSAPVVDPDRVDTAIFYSISNAQAGLSGINFGNFLIKRVVDSLSNEIKGLKNYATLSPISGFMDWVKDKIAGDELTLISERDKEKLMQFSEKKTPELALRSLLSRPGWYKDDDIIDTVRGPLLSLAAYYLVIEKRPSGTALDSVAHFHLNNGARIEQLNWAADLSQKGLEQSAGIMVNYLYDLADIDGNHESYRSGQDIIASAAVRELINA